MVFNPKQRRITINKQPTDKRHKYTANNLDALDQAAGLLVTKGGFKLYMYLAKNQDKYSFALSSADFIKWANLGIAAYNSAFQELWDKGFLVLKEGTETVFSFYDKPNISSDAITIINNKNTVNKVRKVIKKLQE